MSDTSHLPGMPARVPAASYTRFSMRATVSSSSSAMPNLPRSGVKVTRVKFSVALHAAIAGASLACMLSEKTCRYRLPEPAPSAVSTTNSVEKMLASLAPNPLRPPVTFFSPSS